jgi:hypothetical protein
VRRWVCVSVVVLVVALGAPAARAQSAYEAPVDGPIIDVFRPPATPYGPGNRGIDFGTAPGEQVHASADGVVVFAGRVGLSQHVVVLHGDGIRTSYSFLAEIAVHRGDQVAQGDVVGSAGSALHFGARIGGDYLDPAQLLAGAPPVVHLVPVHARRPGSEASERKGLLRWLVSSASASIHAGAQAVEWAREGVEDVVSFAHDLVDDRLTSLLLASSPQRFALDVLAAVRAIVRDQDGCTPRSTPPKPRAGARHLAILVGGFGSAGGHAAILDVDTRALGYADSDVAQFSYRGGQAPGDRQLAGVPVRDYDAGDSSGDIRDAAQQFRDLLERIRLQYPGVPVDIIAHSQGGLVVRTALGEDLDHLDPRLPSVDHVITLGTPHQGADLADFNLSLGAGPIGLLAQGAVREGTDGGTDPWSPAAGQLSTRSTLMDQLDDRPAPQGAQLTSIAASGDLVVPVPRAVLDDADNVVVGLTGLHAHDRLPGSPEAEREMRLALAGQAPTCTSAVDIAVGSFIAAVEHEVGLVTAVAGLGR